MYKYILAQLAVWGRGAGAKNDKGAMSFLCVAYFKQTLICIRLALPLTSIELKNAASTFSTREQHTSTV